MVLESPRTNGKRLIKELIKGKEFAVQLQTLLQQQPQNIANHDYSSDSSAHDVILKIWTSFTEALSELTPSGSKGCFQIPAEADSSNLGDRKLSEDGSECKQVLAKHRRGCYKRRKNLESSWITESASMEDGYSWRKYGQKVILDSKYPRCYYRCTYKYNQDCGATKQVQRSNEDSTIYQTTYFGHHICKESQLQITSESNLKEKSLPFEAKPNVVSDASANISSTMDSELWKDLSMLSSPSAPALVENLSYFVREDFSNDFQFEGIEFS